MKMWKGVSWIEIESLHSKSRKRNRRSAAALIQLEPFGAERRHNCDAIQARRSVQIQRQVESACT